MLKVMKYSFFPDQNKSIYKHTFHISQTNRIFQVTIHYTLDEISDSFAIYRIGFVVNQLQEDLCYDYAYKLCLQNNEIDSIKHATKIEAYMCTSINTYKLACIQIPHLFIIKNGMRNVVSYFSLPNPVIYHIQQQKKYHPIPLLSENHLISSYCHIMVL